MISRDISERMQIESEIRTENMQLKKENRLKSELSSATSNALGALLATLKNIICEAEVDARCAVSPRLTEELKSISENIDRITRAIGDFDDLSGIESGRTKVGAS